MTELYNALVEKFAEERDDVMNGEVLLEFVMERRPELYNIWAWIIDNGQRPHEYAKWWRFVPFYGFRAPEDSELSLTEKYMDYLYEKYDSYSILGDDKAEVYHGMVDMFENVGLPS